MFYLRAAGLALGLFVASTEGSVALEQPLSDSFTYQGKLTESGVPATGVYDIRFSLFTVASGGISLPGGSVVVPGVDVVDGVFQADVDFGTFGVLFTDGQRLWIEAAITPAGGGSETVLSPRQVVMPAPIANYALRSGTTLQDAYRNGNTILRIENGPPVSMLSNSAVDLARLDLGSSAPDDAPGQLVVYGEAEPATFFVAPDTSAFGGGYMQLARNADGNFGFIVQGNVQASQSTEVIVNGTDRIMSFSTQLQGDLSVQLPGDAINSLEIIDEAGIAETEVPNTVQTLTNDPLAFNTIAPITINAPTDGYALVIATAEVIVQHVQGGATAANFALSPDPNSFGAENAEVEIRELASNPTRDYDTIVTIHAAFPVTQGSNTFYFVGNKNTVTNTIQVVDAQTTALFVSTAYGDISRSSELYGGDNFVDPTSGMHAIDVMAEQNRALRADSERQQHEIDTMKEQMQTLRDAVARMAEEQRID